MPRCNTPLPNQSGLRDAVGSSVSAIHAQARSAWGDLRVFGAGIIEPLTSAVPEERRSITIRSSERRPDDATVRIRFPNWWFYIDAIDTQSKM